MPSHIRRFGVLLVFACTAIFVAACGSSGSSSSKRTADNAKTVNAKNIASAAKGGSLVIAGFEGPAAEGGPDFMSGMQLAAHLINTSGGVDGRQIVIKVFPTEGTPQGNVVAYRAAAQQSNIIGSFVGASGALAIKAVSSEYQLPTISASGNYNTVTPVAKYMFTNSFGGEYATSSINYAVAKLHVKKFAILHYETDFSAQIVPSVEARCKQLGCTVTDVESGLSTDSTDQLTPLLEKMKNSGAQAYYIESLNPNGMKAAHQLGMFDKPVIAEQWLATPALASACGTYCEGVVFGASKCRLTSLNQLQPNDPLKAWCAKYIKEFQAYYPGKPFALYSIYGRDAVYTYAEAVKELIAAHESITRSNVDNEMQHFHGQLFNSQGAVYSSPTNHKLVGTWHEAYIDQVIKIVNGQVVYVLAPHADPSGSNP